MILRIGVVIRSDATGLYVALNDIDPEMEWGPLEAVVTPNGILDYAAGNRVLVGNLGTIRDDYIVVGPIMETY